MNAAVLAIWRQPVLERRARGSLALSWILLALFVLGLFSLNLPFPKRQVLFAFFTAVPMGALLIMWWSYLCASVAVQCHPAALQLVPRLRRNVLRAVVLAWLAIVAIVTLLAGVPTGYAPQVAIVTALVLIETSFVQSPRKLILGGLLLWLPSAGATVTGWLGWFATTPAFLLLGTLLVVFDGAAALRRLARPGTVAARPPLSIRARGPGGRAAGRFERGADHQPAFLQPLGRSWLTTPWSTFVVVAVLCLAVRLWTAARGQAGLHDVLGTQRWLLAVGMSSWLALLVYMETQRFAQARTEQALLCLTPAAPAGPSMNRVLARLLVANFAGTWLVLAATTLAALAGLGATMPELAGLVAVWVAALLFSPFLLRDFARNGRDRSGQFLLLGAGLGVAGWAAAAGSGTPRGWLMFAAASLAASVVMAAWRRRAMLAAPPALPAGRVQDKGHVR